MRVRPGVGYQRNIGVSRAKYKYILFLDADIILHRNFLNRFVRKINPEERQVTAAVSWIVEDDLWSRLVMAMMIAGGMVVCFFDPITPGGCLFTTQENHRLVGGFREDIIAAEDLDYGRRSINGGAKYHLILYPYVLHSGRRLRTVGALRLFWFYIKSYLLIKIYGIEIVNKLKYPFGKYGE